jgi:hypothetical protein
LSLKKNTAKGGNIVEVGIVKKKTLVVYRFIKRQMVQPLADRAAISPDKAMDGVTFLEEQFGEIGTVLASDAGD